MAPVRIGLVGLGTSSNAMGPGAWAVAAHLPGLLSSPNYEIVALCNSSVASAKASKTHHKLSDKVKCYGSVADLSADPDVDLVAVVVHVTKHYELAKPALEAGKNVFVEWPLGATLAESEELAALAEKKGVRTVVGSQARADPGVIKVKELLADGKIGKILSSAVTLERSSSVFPEAMKQYAQMGGNTGNLYHIMFGHFLDSFINVLGPVSDIKASLKINFPTVTLIDGSGNVADPAYEKTVPDDIYVQGQLPSGTPVAITVRTVGPAISPNGYRWVISGTEGEIEITAPAMSWQMGGTALRIRLGDSEVQEVDLDEKVFGVDVANAPAPGTNVARLYEAFTLGKEPSSTFESAVQSHRTLEEILKSAGWA